MTVSRTTSSLFRLRVGVFAPPNLAIAPSDWTPLLQDPLTLSLANFPRTHVWVSLFHQSVISGEDWLQWVNTLSWKGVQSETLVVKFSRQRPTFLLFVAEYAIFNSSDPRIPKDLGT